LTGALLITPQLLQHDARRLLCGALSHATSSLFDFFAVQAMLGAKFSLSPRVKKEPLYDHT
jgi:hypothetical protein